MTLLRTGRLLSGSLDQCGAATADYAELRLRELREPRIGVCPQSKTARVA